MASCLYPRETTPVQLRREIKNENCRVSPHECVPINPTALRMVKTLWSFDRSE